MRYVYDIFENGIRIHTTTNFEEAKKEFSYGRAVKVSDELTRNEVALSTMEDFEVWSDKLSREMSWLPKRAEVAWDPLEESDGFHVKDKDMKVGPQKINLTLGQLSLDPTKRTLAEHVDPSHYQGYIATEKETLQWLEAMQYLPRFRVPEMFCAAVELQIRKYLDRSGGKDDELQEFSKALWYMKFLTAFMKNGYKPVRVKDIESILNA